MVFAMLLVCNICICTTLYSTTNGIMPSQNKTIVINYKFDYSQFTIDKWMAREYIIAHENKNNLPPDDAWNLFTQKIEAAFIGIANGRLIQNGYQLSNETESNYEVIIYFKKADSDGEHTILGELYNNGTKTSEIKAHADGDIWNDFSVLLIESMESSVKKFSKRLISALIL